MTTTSTPRSTLAPSGLTLGVDTSTAVCVGLARGGEVLATLRVDDPRAHAEQLMPLIEELCRQQGITLSELNEVAVGVGPGPYTGLRVGVVTGRVLAHLAGLEPRPAPTSVPPTPCRRTSPSVGRAVRPADSRLLREHPSSWMPAPSQHTGRACPTSVWSRSTCVTRTPPYPPLARRPSPRHGSVCHVRWADRADSSGEAR